MILTKILWIMMFFSFFKVGVRMLSVSMQSENRIATSIGGVISLLLIGICVIAVFGIVGQL